MRINDIRENEGIIIFWDGCGVVYFKKIPLKKNLYIKFLVMLTLKKFR